MPDTKGGYGSEIVMLGAFWPYLRFVCRTSTWAHAPVDHLGTVKRNQPVIIALWHGQTMLLPEVLLFEIRPSCAIVANTLVAEPLARTLQRMGIGVIRGAGRSWRGKDRHGARALRAAIKSLAGGVSVAMTADQLTCSRRCGLGIVTLASLADQLCLRLLPRPATARCTHQIDIRSISPTPASH